MSRSTGENGCHLGFLRVAQTEQGYIGGLLVTNRQGRPLEFQCTTPVRPTRTHEILYGSTLQPYVYSELIGKTLVERVGVKPAVIFVQQDVLIPLRSHVDCAVFCLHDGGTFPDETLLTLGKQPLRRHADHPRDEDLLEELRSLIPADADFVEPLERVKDALQETLRANAVA